MTQKSESIDKEYVSKFSNGNVTLNLAFGLVKIWSWLSPPLVAIASLLFSMALYGVTLREHYQHLAVMTFVVTFFIFRELEPVRLKDTSFYRINTTNIMLAWGLVVTLLFVIGYSVQYSEQYSRLTLFTWITITPLLLLLSQKLLNKLNIVLIQSTGHARKVIIAGINDISKRLVDQITADQSLAMKFYGYFEDRSTDRVGSIDDWKVLGKLDDLAAYVNANNIDVIFIAIPISHLVRTKKVLDQLHDATASIYFIPDIFVFDLIQSKTYDINGIPVVSLCETPFVGFTGVLKHISDFIFASIALILFSPIMLLVALTVKLTSKGPIIFKQKRYGLDGRKIFVYKFRTMEVCEDAEDDIVQARRNDPRLTKVGAFLRRYSLDELPQFINVLQGRMSVVGPRPHAVAHNESYRKIIKGYMFRHKVLPGITGLAQVKGFRGETNEVGLMQKRIEYDLEYLRNWSIQLDIKILFLTLYSVIVTKNAY